MSRLVVGIPRELSIYVGLANCYVQYPGIAPIMTLMPIIKYSENSDVVKIALRNFRNDNQGVKFDGIISNGKIHGMYSFHTLQSKLNGYVLSTLKLVGKYDIETGEIEIRLKASIILYLMLIVPTFLYANLIWNNVTRNETLIPSAIALTFATFFLILPIFFHLLEIALFKKDLERAIKKAQNDIKVKKNDVHNTV